ncbi:MAG: ABC transporter permease [Deferribacteraceae bacterium]|jgi:NitT/TauT family transport system permease protein|nr:ABC transporter permease [Deferribacteraceae bacterium]
MRVLPSPITVCLSYKKAFGAGILMHAAASAFRTAAGIFSALIIGSVIGLLMGYNRSVNRILSPIVYLSYPVPKLALLPIVMLFFGIDDLSKIIMIVLIIVFQLIVSIRDAAVSVPKESYDLLVSLKAASFDKVRHITVPAVLPAVFSTLRVSAGTAISVLMVAETFGTDRGLGFYIIDSWMRADYVQMYFGILILSLIGFVIFITLDFMEYKICRWKN